VHRIFLVHDILVRKPSTTSSEGEEDAAPTRFHFLVCCLNW